LWYRFEAFKKSKIFSKLSGLSSLRRFIGFVFLKIGSFVGRSEGHELNRWGMVLSPWQKGQGDVGFD